MARWPQHNDAHEAHPQEDTPAGSAGAALVGVRRLKPLGDWLLATFSLDRWLVASVAAIAIVAGGVVSTSFLANGPRESVALPALRDPQDVTLVQAEPPAELEPQVASEPAAAPVQEPKGVQANRADCDEIRGTAYLSEVERFWFVATCVEQEPADEEDVFVSAAAPDRPLGVGGPGPVESADVAPPAPVSPSPAFGPDDAAYVVHGWLVYQGYDPVEGSCYGGGAGNQWTVTCLVEPLDECVGPGCLTLVTGCLIAEPRTAWFC